MKTFSGVMGAIVLAGFFLPLAANAQTETLTYTGNPFNQASFGGNLSLAEAYAPAMDLGTVVLSTPLGDNLNDVFVTPESYTFAGGGPTSLYLNSSNPNSGGFRNVATFEFSTDATGILTQWNVNITGGIFGGTNSPSSASVTLGMSGDTFSAALSSPACAAPPEATIPCFSISESNISSSPFSAAGHWQQAIAPSAPEIDPGTAGSALTLLAGLAAMVRARRRAAA
jgi:hypothetical protein